jgi:hypothetical protein
MKSSTVINTLFMASMLAMGTLIGCNPPGHTTQQLQGDEASLPAALKGLKVYRVAVENGVYAYVGVMDEEVNSITTTGKHGFSTIIVREQQNAEYKVKSIVMENDTLIMFKK